MGETHSDPLASAPVATQHRFLLPLLTLLLCSCCVILHGQSLQPQGTPPPPSSRADVLYRTAVNLLSERKYEEAEDTFRKLADLEILDSRATMGIAEVWVAQKREDDALRLLQEETRKHPDRPGVHVGIGNLATRMAKYDLAIAEYQLALDRIDRNSKGAADLYVRLGEAYRAKGDLDFAIEVLRQAQSLQPANPAIVSRLALTLEFAGKRQEAGDQYSKLIRLDPKNGIALNNLAYLLADTDGDTALALAYAHRARQLFPNEPTFADTLGWVYFKLNRAEDAIPLFREVVQKDPGRATYHYHLAAALEMHGDHAEARKESESALKSNPSKDDEQKINDLLRKIK